MLYDFMSEMILFYYIICVSVKQNELTFNYARKCLMIISIISIHS